jgi:transposase InsO family protein
MDFIVALPLSNGYDAISVVIDRFSKQAHFIPAKSTDDAPETSERFVENVVRHHGVPSEIVSDRDPKFTSRFWKELFKLLGTKLSLSTAAHPETDGQTERTNLTS